MYIVRYADDFRILCRTKEQADRTLIAVTHWLKERSVSYTHLDVYKRQVILYGRMIEIYCTVSIAPIPIATMSNREWGSIGTNLSLIHI